MLGQCTAPLYAGVSVSDPHLDIGALVDRAAPLGFSGVCNFPATMSIEGQLRELREREGLGTAREMKLVEIATARGLGSFVYVHTNSQARAMVDAGASAICVDIGFTGGATGVATNLTLGGAAARIDRVLEGVPASVDKLCHGGPIASPEDALAITKISKVQGFVAGSTLDRIPLERALTEVTRGFTAIPSLKHATRPQDNTDRQLIGSSQAMRDIRRDLRELATEDIPVMILGASGTGKSLAAQTLHDQSPRRRKKLVTVDCAALDEDSGAVHLLGFAAGKLYGPSTQRGALEQAAGSAVLFEDVPELRRGLQRKIMRFVDNRAVQRIGDLDVREVDTRIISTATSQTFADIEGTELRTDLAYRLAGHVIALPPLSKRVDDIPELIDHFASEATGNAPKFSNSALRLLYEHDWRANVRELKFTVLRAIRKTDGAVIEGHALAFLRKTLLSDATGSEPAETFRSEKEMIAACLARNGFRRAPTAKELGISTRTLYNKIKHYGLQT